MGGPRNNLSWHPPEVRYRVYALHYEGYSAAQITADPEVAASVSKTGYRLHGNTLKAAFRSEECRRYLASREKTFAATEADRITQAVLGEAGALSSITDVARYELAREIRDLIGDSAGEGEDPVERVERLTRSLATVSRDEAAKMARQLVERDAEIARLNDRITRLQDDNSRLRAIAGQVDSAEVANEMDKRVGL